MISRLPLNEGIASSEAKVLISVIQETTTLHETVQKTGVLP